MTTKEIYELLRTETYRDNTKFGGLVHEYDFDSGNTMCQIASRMMSDEKFDKSCKKNRENEIRNKNYKRGF